MQATVNLSDSLYEKTEALAVSRGTTVEQIILGAVADAVQEKFEAPRGCFGDLEIELPVIRSNRPGTLDLSSFDFDDLLT